LSDKQVDFARNIHSAAPILLNLINDILDLSKIESGTVAVEAEISPSPRCVSRWNGTSATLQTTRAALRRRLRSVRCRVISAPNSKRLQQIIKNLLSNAFKYPRPWRVSKCGGSSVPLTHGSEAKVLSSAFGDCAGLDLGEIEKCR